MATLTYFNGRWRPEAIRLALVEADVQFTDKRVDNLAELKASGKLPYGQLPIYEDPDVGVLPQTNAILRYIGKKYGFYSNDPLEAAKIDQLIDATDDMRYRPFFANTDELKKKCVEEDVKTWLAALEKQLNGDFFVGNRLTIADFAVFALIDSYLLDPKYKPAVEGFPKLIEYHKKIAARPKIASGLHLVHKRRFKNSMTLMQLPTFNVCGKEGDYQFVMGNK